MGEGGDWTLAAQTLASQAVWSRRIQEQLQLEAAKHIVDEWNEVGPHYRITASSLAPLADAFGLEMKYREFE